jgi:ubiquitin-conjugating enzyme E2 variant
MDVRRPGLDGLERWGCGAAIGMAIALWAAHTARLASSLALADVPWVLAALLLGALAADLVTGLVHWACDTWGDERTPWLGPTLIYAFREHHERPREMLDRHWALVNREPGLTAALLLVLLSLPAAQATLEGRSFVQMLLLSFVGYAASANQLHLWAHHRLPPRPVRLAQRLGLVLSPERHARHHRRPHTSAYCISTGWLNPALDRLGFWRALERLVSQLTGARARAGQSQTRRVRST